MFGASILKFRQSLSGDVYFSASYGYVMEITKASISIQGSRNSAWCICKNYINEWRCSFKAYRSINYAGHTINIKKISEISKVFKLVNIAVPKKIDAFEFNLNGIDNILKALN